MAVMPFLPMACIDSIWHPTEEPTPEEEDCPSKQPLCRLELYPNSDGTELDLEVRAEDSGRNAGITRIELYEHDRLIAVYSDPTGENQQPTLTSFTSQTEDGFYRRLGRIYYSAKCIDNDGNEALADGNHMFNPPLIPDLFYDLEVQYFLIQGPEIPVSNEDVVFAFLLKNNGTIDIKADYQLEFGDGEILEDVVSLPAGEGKIIMRKHQYTSSGEYCASMIVDPYNLIREMTPGGINNCKTLELEVF